MGKQNNNVPATRNNPDLVERFRIGADLNEADPTTFYTREKEGYLDYPFLTAKQREALQIDNLQLCV